MILPTRGCICMRESQVVWSAAVPLSFFDRPRFLRGPLLGCPRSRRLASRGKYFVAHLCPSVRTALALTSFLRGGARSLVAVTISVLDLIGP